MKYTLIALSLVVGNAYAEDWEIEGFVDNNGDTVCVYPQGVKEGDRVFCDGNLLYIQGFKSSEGEAGGSSKIHHMTEEEIYLHGEDVRRSNEIKGVSNTNAYAPSGVTYIGAISAFQSRHNSYIYNYDVQPRTFAFESALKIGAKRLSNIRHYTLRKNQKVALYSELKLAPHPLYAGNLATTAYTNVYGYGEQSARGYGNITVR